ncbi:MAG TPA: low affinity iron permease family protein [Gemmatimonadales bacterium]|nr:low affinity iron permease family protein [Gemmatimonadales bacterium]
MSLTESFSHLAKWTARSAGHPSTFGLAVGVILIWAATGPIFHFSDTWQLVINTGTTVVTFLMVFLIQSTQNRDGIAVQLKLDELIRAVHGARNSTLSLEELTEQELEELRTDYLRLATAARSHIRQRKERGGASSRSDQAEIGSSAASGKATKKASTA